MIEKQEWIKMTELLIQAAKEAGVKNVKNVQLAWWATDKEMAKAAIVAFATGAIK